MVRIKGLPAKLWKRVVAYIIDSFIISFIILTPFGAAFNTGLEVKSFTDFYNAAISSFTGDVLILALVIGALVLLYWSFLEWKFGQSVGKILLRIEVKSSKKKKLKYMQALMRNITKLSTILLILDTLYMLFKKSNQRYFEILSSTYVVEEKR